MIINPEQDDGHFTPGPSPEVQQRCFESWASFLVQCRYVHEAALGADLHPLQHQRQEAIAETRKTGSHNMLDAWSLFATRSDHVHYTYLCAW